MGLKEDLSSVMVQGDNYVEEPFVENQGSTSTPNQTESTQQEESTRGKRGRAKRDFPKKENSGDNSNKSKAVIFGAVALLGVALLVLAPKQSDQDQGADFLQEMPLDENGNPIDVPTFSYSYEERDLLRTNGFTADDIERFELEEADPYLKVQEAQEKRQEQYDAEIKPYLDGASKEFKELKKHTWLGYGKMSKKILEIPGAGEQYSSYTHTVNCDYEKVPAYGCQLFVRVILKDYDTCAFMNVSPQRYVELEDKGNIVVNLGIQEYADGVYLITSISEKDIYY